MNEMMQIALQAPVYATADVVVVGGGPAGVAAAIAAARSHARVILIERSGQLGGMATLGNVSIFMTVGNLTGIYKEIIAAIRPDFLAQHTQPEKLKIQFNPLLLAWVIESVVPEAVAPIRWLSALIPVFPEVCRPTSASQRGSTDRHR